VYFATNRQADPGQAGGFGAGVVAPSAMTYAAIDVTGTDLAEEDSGQLGMLLDPQPDGLATVFHQEIVATGKNLLVFIHGFDNSFEDAIKRSAFNRDWFASTGKPAADMTVLAFTWPSLGELVENPFDLPEAYEADQKMAGQSGPHIAEFFKEVGLLRTKLAPGRRIVLLVHSMGNFALQAAITEWFAHGNAGSVLFDEVILAAADEVDNSFIGFSGARLARLPELTGRVSVYSSRRDVAMSLSHMVNNGGRIGFDGPRGIVAAGAYPYDSMAPTALRSVDCTEVHDFLAIIPPDATHQYYRRSKTVRDDIAAVIAGERVAPGRSSLQAPPF
jgi:esterase/lipase superfamily enzyme